MLSLVHGIPWVHIAPAILAVILGFLYLQTKWIYMKMLWGILWVLLIPNTAYIFIDVTRITLHWNSANMIMRLIIILQYILLEIIGLISFLLAMLPFENSIHTKHFSQKTQILAIILFNFIIGFGMVLGRTGYTNSYVVFVKPMKVFAAGVHIITSFHLLSFVALFGLMSNSVYFLFRSPFLSYIKKLL